MQLDSLYPDIVGMEPVCPGGN